MRKILFNNNYQIRAGWRILAFSVGISVIGMPFIVLSAMTAQFLNLPKTLQEALPTLALMLTGAILSYYALTYLDKRRFDTLGLKMHLGAMKEFGFGLLIGFVMLTLTVLVPFSLGHFELTLAPEDMSYFITGFSLNLILFTIVGFNEEILFRGYVFQRLIEGLGNFWATIVFSSLFGVAHFFNPNPSTLGFANIMLAGVLLSLAYIQTKSLWLPIGIHISWNFTQGYIWGMHVSGTTVHSPMIISTPLEGTELTTGGAFGPEGGLVCTIICSIACIVVWKMFKPTEEMETIVAEGLAIQPFKPEEKENLPPV